MSGLTRLYLAQRGLCFHCQEPMLYKIKRNKKQRGGWRCYTREHVIPRYRGGGAGKNIVLAHSSCNLRRGRAEPTAEMLVRANEIWERAVRISEEDVLRFTSDRAVAGTLCIGYEWPEPQNDPVFDPTTVKLKA
jgi:hypothetical protein